MNDLIAEMWDFYKWLGRVFLILLPLILLSILIAFIAVCGWKDVGSPVPGYKCFKYRDYIGAPQCFPEEEEDMG